MSDPLQSSSPASASAEETSTPSGTFFANPPHSPHLAANRYQLLDEIAHGGMGIIYRATDTALSREVAVKVLHEKSTADLTAAHRFAAETRITAQLQHPAIPPVHDCGILPDGRPFLAMKLIKGRTLDQLLRQRSDPAADRGRFIAVFEQVCQAVAYGHAHQVIHRDLKPGNVMVGGFGEVQVMDWGLAKVLTKAAASVPPTGEQDETVAGTLIRGSDSLDTQAGSILGTLAYMPPEQAAGEIDKVDARSDVFGLGAILAVILTCKPPYVGPDSEAVRVMAIRGDLVACLARLDGCGAEAELVALCKRCLAFEPSDRPYHAGAVAEEIARLRAEAEERARAAERERAAAEARVVEQRRKRRWQLAAAGTVMLALLAGLGGLAAFLRAQKQTNAELQAANQREHERFELAIDAIQTFHTGVSEDALLKQAEFKSLRERLLRESARFYNKLQEMLEGQPDASSQRALARSYFLLADLTANIGSLDESLALHRKALELRRALAAQGVPGAELEVARSLEAIAGWLAERGDYKDARKAAAEARDLAEGAGLSDEALALLGDCNYWLGILSWLGREWKDSLRSWEQALEIRRRLADANPSDAGLRRKWVQAYANVVLSLWQLGRQTEARKAQRKVIENWEKEAGADPRDASVQDSLAKAHNNMGTYLEDSGNLAQAAVECARAVEIEQRAIDASPAVGTFKSNQAIFSMSLGRVLQQLKRPEEALQAQRKAAKILKSLADAHEADILKQFNLANNHTDIGILLVMLGKPGEALQEFDQALLLYRKLGASSALRQGHIPETISERGVALQKLGRVSEAVASFRESITLLEKLAEPEPDDIYALSCSYALLHAIAGEKGSGMKTEDKDGAAEKAVATLRRAIAAGYRKAVWIRNDTKLDSLRKRPDFEKLMADLEKDIKVSDK